MPRVLSYTPSWLSRPTPGFEVFAAKQKQAQTNGTSNKPERPVASRIIALRGTEVFVAVGNEIRWSDLAWLKEIEEEQYDGQAYRVLKAGIHGEIKQLVISPMQDYLAIATSHTVHVLSLPDSSLLNADDTTPLKPKFFQVGPTAHVVEEAPIVSVIWHPLGALGRCLITVTRDAILRLWEINQDNKCSFADASLSVDLKKLANAVDTQADLRASRFGSGKTFSPDLADLEPAAICFGASTPTSRNPWALTTLWIATVDGGLYALCPLLPARWQPFEGMLDSLFLNADAAENEAPDDLRTWLLNLRDQDPLIIQNRFDAYKVYNRPIQPGAVPRLQGPFLLDPSLKADYDLADIYVTETAPPHKETIDEEDDEEGKVEDCEELSSSLVYLLTTEATVHIALDTDGVEAQWLPSRAPFSTPSAVPTVPEQELRPLLLLESVALYPENNYPSSIVPSFTPDIISPHAVFITHATGVTFLSLASWVERLQQEVEQFTAEGADVRYDVLLTGHKALIEHILQFPDGALQSHQALRIATAAVLEDSDVGYLLLTLANYQPYAATLDLSNRDRSRNSVSASPFIKVERGTEANTFPPPVAESPILSITAPREPYHENPIFYDDSIPSAITELLSRMPAHQRVVHKEEIRLSEASLAILVSAHRQLSERTARVADAAGELFRRCEGMVKEFRHQIGQVQDLGGHVDGLTGDYDDERKKEGNGARGDEGPREVGARRIEKRLEEARDRQRHIMDRIKGLRVSVARIDGREVSLKEKAFRKELEGVAERLDRKIVEEIEGNREPNGAHDAEERTDLQKRHACVKSIKDELLAEAKEIVESNIDGEEGRRELSPIRVSTGFRAERERSVMDLLEREDALLEAVTERVNKLNVR